jgi:hypothetical protein
MALVLITTTPLKALLELLIPPSARAHDACVQLLALVIGVVWATLLLWAQGPVSRSQELGVIVAVVLGVGGGAGGIGAFHVAKALSAPGEKSETADSTTTTTTTVTKTTGKPTAGVKDKDKDTASEQHPPSGGAGP